MSFDGVILECLKRKNCKKINLSVKKLLKLTSLLDGFAESQEDGPGVDGQILLETLIEHLQINVAVLVHHCCHASAAIVAYKYMLYAIS